MAEKTLKKRQPQKLPIHDGLSIQPIHVDQSQRRELPRKSKLEMLVK